MEVRCFAFGPFMLIPERHLLLRAGVPVRLGTRPLDILTVLVERAGELLDKREIISLVWNDTFVDESNLKVNIAAIRKAIDPRHSRLSCIATVSGRGYRFVEPVRVAGMPKAAEVYGDHVVVELARQQSLAKVPASIGNAMSD